MHTRRVVIWSLLLIVFGAPLCAGSARADGEPTAALSDTGVIVPMEETNATVLYQKVTIAMPAPGTDELYGVKPAVVRADYILRNRSDKPLAIVVGWPTTGTKDENGRLLRPAIKLDGDPVASSFLSYADLQRQVEEPWRRKIDRMLQSKPALSERVLAIRKEGKSNGHGTFWMRTAGVGKLTNWMLQNGFAVGSTDQNVRNTRRNTETVAQGLLGNEADQGYQPGVTTQAALNWLDPAYKRVNLDDLMMQRWGFETRLLNPVTRRLEDLIGPILYGPHFGLFVFRITLQPGKQHGLAVQYRQALGFSGAYPESDFTPAWYGLVYLMEPSKRWGEWKKTEIEVRVPNGWKRSAIRPTAKIAGNASGIRVYRITMDGRPHTNLWVSVEPR